MGWVMCRRRVSITLRRGCSGTWPYRWIGRPVSMACRDNSGWGEYRREDDFLQIPTAEECSTGRERSRLAGGVPPPGERTSNTSLPPISLEALTLCSFCGKRRYRSVCGLWLQRVRRRSEMNRKRRTLKYF